MTISIQKQIEMLKAEQEFDLFSGEFQWTQEHKRPTPYTTEKEAWMAIVKIRQYRHDNHLLYAIFDPRLNEDGYYYIWERREILK